MNQQQKSLRVGITAIAAAVVLRFFSLNHLEPVIDRLLSSPLAELLLCAETGRKLPGPDEETVPGPTIEAMIFEPELPYSRESPPPVPPPLPFFPDASGLELTYLCGYRPDVQALLRRPLSWDLASGAPTVLIFHTHTTESYEKGSQDYVETAAYRTLDPDYNMLAVGEHIRALLEENGITVIHDRSVHDYPDYNGCYGRTRKSVHTYLKEYPSLRLILDLHRDACDSGTGQLRTLARVDGKDSAQLMLVVGSNAGGSSHRQWAENLSLGLKLQAQLTAQCPGIVRPLSLRAQRFNQDLSTGALLIEVGGAGNTLEEALLAAGQLAQAITALSRGTADPNPAPPS